MVVRVVVGSGCGVSVSDGGGSGCIKVTSIAQEAPLSVMRRISGWFRP